jgi:hypothetical protein
MRPVRLSMTLLLYWLPGISVLLSGKKSLKRNVSPPIHWEDGKENERISQVASTSIHWRFEIVVWFPVLVSSNPGAILSAFVRWRSLHAALWSSFYQDG